MHEKAILISKCHYTESAGDTLNGVDHSQQVTLSFHNYLR